jgi:hypothetical protein
VSLETKQKLRKPKSLEGRLNMKVAAKNRKPTSEETKQKMREKRKGVPKSEEWKEKVRKPKGKQKIVKCEYCGIEGGISNMNRYHFENCKFYI